MVFGTQPQQDPRREPPCLSKEVLVKFICGTLRFNAENIAIHLMNKTRTKIAETFTHKIGEGSENTDWTLSVEI